MARRLHKYSHGRAFRPKENQMNTAVDVKGSKTMRTAMLALALALAGCAAVARSAQEDPLAGNWVGVIDRDGWQRPLSIMIDAKSGAYAGSWMSLENQPGVMLQRVERTADAVHIELASLVFDGRVAGRTLAGTVAQRDGSGAGTFLLTRVDPTDNVTSATTGGP
jgi:hypothetical protein